jgi:hypothetical protein
LPSFFAYSCNKMMAGYKGNPMDAYGSRTLCESTVAKLCWECLRLSIVAGASRASLEAADRVLDRVTERSGCSESI